MNNIIIIQRYYRLYLLKKKLKLIVCNRDCNLYCNIESESFSVFNKKLLNRDMIRIVDNFITQLNRSFKPIDNAKSVRSRILLTSFLIVNFSKELLGNKEIHTTVDIILYNQSVLLIKTLANYNNCNFKLLHNILNEYYELFDYWIKFDKNRTIQNIIVSYYNRMMHAKEIEIKGDNDPVFLNMLNKQCSDLLDIIKKLDNTIDIVYIKENYVSVYENMNRTMTKLLDSIVMNFHKLYNEHIIDEFKNKQNKQVIYDLIVETNTRIQLIIPLEYSVSIDKKLASYQYTSLLLEDTWTDGMIDYVDFLIDTLYQITKDNSVIELKQLFNNDMNQESYHDNLPVLLLEINKRIRIILNLTI
jgi:hypothetical protein